MQNIISREDLGEAMKAWRQFIACVLAESMIAFASCAMAQAPQSSPAVPRSTQSATSAPESHVSESFRVVTEDQIKDWWQVDSSHSSVPPYPKWAIQRSVHGCLAVAIVIHSDGTVTPIRVLRAKLTNIANKSELERFEAPAVSMLASSRYVPAQTNAGRTPVFTYLPIGYALSDNENSDDSVQAKKECGIPDFSREIQQIMSKPASSSATQ